jgi:hypothetical protein
MGDESTSGVFHLEVPDFIFVASLLHYDAVWCHS